MWSKPDALDRLAQGLVGLAALIALGNGLFMLLSPLGWYDGSIEKYLIHSSSLF